MNKIISRYKVKTGVEEKTSANVLYEFIIIAIASLIFNGFIVNGHSAKFDQKIFMLFNAGLLSTHWYARTFFAQRYEKKGVDFRALILLSIFSLGAIAVSIDLLVFTGNQTKDQQVFLNHVSMYIWASGYILSRGLTSYNYLMSALANKDSHSLFKLTIYKSISRFIAIILASIFVILISMGFERDILIYSFFPLFVLVEYIGNSLFVTDKVIKKAPKVHYDDLKERYSKINNILISAFIISGTIQFAFYFKDSSDLYMLARISIVYIITFLLWWTYSNRVYRFGIKTQASSHVLLGATNIFIAASLAIMGGMLINANDSKNLDIIIPSVLFSLAIFILLITINIYTFKNKNKFEIFNKGVKKYYIFQSIVAIIPLIIIAVISLYFSFSVWVMYGMVTGSLAWLAISSRLVIETKIKNNI